ncbi:hypothetical protein PULV_b0639 [Pseudoalteromonas ulvae UL12]|nr:hypothetical protein [Pseudoalteromonas ulvae UL12]
MFITRIFFYQTYPFCNHILGKSSRPTLVAEYFLVCVELAFSHHILDRKPYLN